MKKAAHIALALVCILVVVSAYLRLHSSGIGCPDWPACYGQIGVMAEPTEDNMAGNAYARIVAESDAPLAWAAPLHRLIASLLGLVILYLFIAALRAKKHRVLTGVLLVLTVFLALIGLKSGSLHHPGVVMGNLVGGFAMLGLLGWLVFSFYPGSARYTETHIRHIQPHALTAIIFLCLQIVLGGLTSANFAGTACPDLLDCQGGWVPDGTIYSALKLNEVREVDDNGFAIGGLERVAIQRAHRIGAVLATLAVLIAVIAGFRGTLKTRQMAILALVLLLAELSIGVATIIKGLPIGLAVAHNWIAGLLLLVLLRLYALGKEKWWLE